MTSRRPLASLLPAAAGTAGTAGSAGTLRPAPAHRAAHEPGARATTRGRAPAPERAAGLGTPTRGRTYLALAGLALALGAASLLAPSTPSYDPWSWTLWGHEIVHGGLVITDTGTSWKPLPMLFTIPFALLGRAAAPDLWLAVARAGAIAAVLLAFRLAYRLTRALGDPADRSLAARAPAALAGMVALVGLGFAAKGSYITSNGLGYSEALATALLLATIECGLDGRHRVAFGLGCLVALDRPEVWLFWVPYGLWLGRREPTLRVLIAAAFVLQPVAWFLPVYLGSGHLGSSVTRATHPRANSLAFAGDPFWAELSRAAWPRIMLRVKLMAGLVVLGPLATLGWRRWTGRPAAPGSPPARRRALAIAAALGVGGLAWFVVIAVMTEIGFSGNNRYLVLGAALVDVCAAVGFGWLALTLGRAWRARRPGWGAATLGTAVAAAVFALVPGWIQTRDFVSLPAVHRALLYQAHLRDYLPRAIALAGGRQHLLACGTVMSEGFQVPMVAYALDVPTTRVLAPPASRASAGRAPNVILQTRATRSSTHLPQLRDWRAERYAHRGAAGPWHTYTDCGSGS